MFNNYNPYYNQMQQQRFQQPIPSPMSEPVQQASYMQPQYNKPMGLQGKMVDSLEVAKAADISFEGITYFPLTDGSQIITKQIQMDGTSKIVIFEPINEQKQEIKYLTKDDLKIALDDLNLDKLDEFEDELKEIKKELKELKKK